MFLRTLILVPRVTAADIHPIVRACSIKAGYLYAKIKASFGLFDYIIITHITLFSPAGLLCVHRTQYLNEQRYNE